MRKVISLILVLVFCMSLAGTAFATNASSPDKMNCDHNFKNGVCTECGTACNHDFEGGVCSICGVAESEAGSPKTGDVIMTYVIVMVISLAALVAVGVIFRKKFAR